MKKLLIWGILCGFVSINSYADNKSLVACCSADVEPPSYCADAGEVDCKAIMENKDKEPKLAGYGESSTMPDGSCPINGVGKGILGIESPTSKDTEGKGTKAVTIP